MSRNTDVQTPFESLRGDFPAQVEPAEHESEALYPKRWPASMTSPRKEGDITAMVGLGALPGTLSSRVRQRCYSSRREPRICGGHHHEGNSDNGSWLASMTGVASCTQRALRAGSTPCFWRRRLALAFPREYSSGRK
jgi:hypothetical protein